MQIKTKLTNITEITAESEDTAVDLSNPSPSA